MAVNPELTIKKLICLPHELAREIADYRFTERVGSEAEAIRQLIRAGLECQRKQAAEAKKPRK